MNDPIVAEVRQFRWEHTQRFQGDLTAICADLRKLEQTCGHPVVHFEPKPIFYKKPATQSLTEEADQ